MDLVRQSKLIEDFAAVSIVFRGASSLDFFNSIGPKRTQPDLDPRYL